MIIQALLGIIKVQLWIGVAIADFPRTKFNNRTNLSNREINPYYNLFEVDHLISEQRYDNLFK